MAQYSLPNSSVTDWSKASVNKVVTSSNTLSLGYATLFSASGKGYLKKVLINPTSAMTVNMRITIDGTQTVIISKVINGTTSAMGIIVTDLVTAGTSLAFSSIGGSAYTIQGSTMGQYPDTTGTKESILLTQPIYFNSSLLVEVYGSASVVTCNIEYDYCVM